MCLIQGSGQRWRATRRAVTEVVIQATAVCAGGDSPVFFRFLRLLGIRKRCPADGSPYPPEGEIEFISIRGYQVKPFLGAETWQPSLACKLSFARPLCKRRQTEKIPYFFCLLVGFGIFKIGGRKQL